MPVNNIRISKLNSEINQIKKNESLKALGIVIEPNTENIGIWHATFKGPEGTPYEGGVFRVEIKFPDNYPFSAPQIVFLNKVFHPNIYMNGKICLDILGGQWTPVMNVQIALLSLISLLDDPNIDSPANSDAASLYKRDRDAYNKKVKEFMNNAVVNKSISSDSDDSDEIS